MGGGGGWIYGAYAEDEVLWRDALHLSLGINTCLVAVKF